MTRRRCAAVSVGVLVGLSAAACGDGSDTSTDTAQRTRQRAPAAADRPAVCYEAPQQGEGESITLSDATEALGVAEPLTGLYGHATAVGDVNGDGWDDVFVGVFTDDPGVEETSDRLLLGSSSGFTLDETFPQQRGRTSGAAFADLDRDGDLDLILARNHRDAPSGRAPSLVFRNDAGRFTPATELDTERGARSVGVLDYDGDALLDVFLVEDRFAGGSSVLLRNAGDLQFADATAAAGLPDDVHGLGVAAADLNGTGGPDLFVGGSNRLFVNDGEGAFREVRTSVFEWPPMGDEDDPAGVAAGDLNRDGRPDLVVGQHYNSTVDRGAEVPVRLYLNEGADDEGTPSFRDVTEAAGLVPLPTKAPHVEVADLDADGWPDIVTTASAAGGSQPAVFRHLGLEDGVPRFAAPDGLGDHQYWVAGATFDADRDGRLDVLLVEFDPTLVSRLLRNDSESGHWLAVEIGATGAAGVGARVAVYRAGGLGDDQELIGAREISSSTGYGAGAAPVASFGLGPERSVDVRVEPVGKPPIDLVEVTVDRMVVIVGDRDACGA